MKVGIVGLNQSGKTALFRAITRGQAPVDEYGGHANVGVVPIPDGRLVWIAEQYRPKKVTPAAMEFIDGRAKAGAGPGAAAHRTEKLGADFFADVRAVDALLHVVRAFTSPSGDAPNPARDARALTEELILSDLQIVETRLARLAKSIVSVRHGTTTPETIERDLLLVFKEALESGRLAKSIELAPDQEKMLRGFDFMTAKPQIVVANIPEDQIGQEEWNGVRERDGARSLRAYCEESGLPVLVISAKLEAEVAELPEDEQKEYLEAMGLAEPAADRLIRETDRALGLVTFYTASEPEVRAWMVPKGTHVIDAAGKVHTDMARGFIRAEVGHFDDVKAAGGWEEAKRAGAVHLQMKDYVVQDGDIVYVRFKV